MQAICIRFGSADSGHIFVISLAGLAFVYKAQRINARKMLFIGSPKCQRGGGGQLLKAFPPKHLPRIYQPSGHSECVISPVGNLFKTLMRGWMFS